MKRTMIGKITAFAMAAVMVIGIGFAFGKTANAATQMNEQEPNNAIIRANSISAGNEFYGSISDNNDIDYFKFTLPSSGQVKFTVYTDFTFWLYLYDSGENKLASQTWEYAGEYRYTYYLTKGTYYIRLSGNTGNYNFYYSFTSSNETFPETGNGTNNMVSKANTIKTDTLYRGMFAINDDIDYYKLVMNEPGTLNMTTNSEDYVKLKVYDVKENVVWEDTYGFRGESQRTITLTKGTYYFEFYKYASTNYNFKLTFNGIKFKDSDSTVVCGNSMNLSLLNVGNWDVSWKSSNSSIAQVTDGRVLANKAGSVTIMATCEGKTVKKVLQVLYKDVTDPKDFWFEPTNVLTNRGIVQGYDRQTTFKPENNCTRAQMVTFLWRLKGTPNPKASTTKFKDVKKSAYYFKAVLWATEKGITTGYSKTSFKPNNVCTRAQTVTFLWRMANKPNPKSTANKFKDIGKKDYFYKAVLWASEKKIVEGYKNKTFRPQNKCTRRQMVTFLYKYSKNVR